MSTNAKVQGNNIDNKPNEFDSEETPNESHEVCNASGSSNVVIVCDHATWQMPAEFEYLGVSKDALRRHVGWDIGALKVARLLSDELDAVCISTKYSRLLTDANRFPGDPTQFVEVSDGVVIAGNKALDADETAARLTRFFWPYHRAISTTLDNIESAGREPVVLSIHSFTPHFGDSDRPWHIGVLWNDDERLARPMINALSRNADVCVGDNQPYSGRSPLGYTVAAHAEDHDRFNLLLEIRQDLIDNNAGVQQWSRRLLDALQTLKPHLNTDQEQG